jgi:hypothetical protein
MHAETANFVVLFASLSRLSLPQHPGEDAISVRLAGDRGSYFCCDHFCRAYDNTSQQGRRERITMKTVRTRATMANSAKFKPRSPARRGAQGKNSVDCDAKF